MRDSEYLDSVLMSVVVLRVSNVQVFHGGWWILHIDYFGPDEDQSD